MRRSVEVPSEKRRLPVPMTTGKTDKMSSSTSPASTSGLMSVELPRTTMSGPGSDLMRRRLSPRSGPTTSFGPQVRPSGRWVATYFLPAFRRSATGPLGAVGQNLERMS